MVEPGTIPPWESADEMTVEPYMARHYLDELKPLGDAIAEYTKNPADGALLREVERCVVRVGKNPLFQCAPDIASHYENEGDCWGDFPIDARIAVFKREGLLDAIVSDGERYLTKNYPSLYS